MHPSESAAARNGVETPLQDFSPASLQELLPFRRPHGLPPSEVFELAAYSRSQEIPQGERVRRGVAEEMEAGQGKFFRRGGVRGQVRQHRLV